MQKVEQNALDAARITQPQHAEEQPLPHVCKQDAAYDKQQQASAMGRIIVGFGGHRLDCLRCLQHTCGQMPLLGRIFAKTLFPTANPEVSGAAIAQPDALAAACAAPRKDAEAGQHQLLPEPLTTAAAQAHKAAMWTKVIGHRPSWER